MLRDVCVGRSDKAGQYRISPAALGSESAQTEGRCASINVKGWGGLWGIDWFLTPIYFVHSRLLLLYLSSSRCLPKRPARKGADVAPLIVHYLFCLMLGSCGVQARVIQARNIQVVPSMRRYVGLPYTRRVGVWGGFVRFPHNTNNKQNTPATAYLVKQGVALHPQTLSTYLPVLIDVVSHGRGKQQRRGLPKKTPQTPTQLHLIHSFPKRHAHEKHTW